MRWSRDRALRQPRSCKRGGVGEREGVPRQSQTAREREAGKPRVSFLKAIKHREAMKYDKMN